MSGHYNRRQEDRGRYDSSRDDYNSGRFDGRRGDYHGRDRCDRGNDSRRRSRSPGCDRDNSNTRGRGGSSRGDFRRGSGNRGGLDGNLSVSSGSTGSKLPSLPSSALFPEGTGAELPYPEHITRGKVGRRITVLANHHVIQCLPVIKIYQYDLRFRVPESCQAKGSDKITANQMARILISTTLVDFLKENFIFDGVSLGWSPKELMPVGEARSTAISLGARRDGKPNEVEVNIRNAGILDIRSLVNYLKNGRIELNPAGNPSLENTFKWLQALLRDDPARRLISRPNSNAFFQRKKETSMALASTGGVLEALRGVYQTVQLRFSHLSVCVDTTTTPFWSPELSLIDCVCALAGERSPQNLQQRFLSNPGHFFQACGMLLGCYFNVRHLNPNRNAKKVKFLSWSGQDSYSTTFDELVDDSTKQSISVFDYFLKKYQIKLLYPSLPLAHTRDGDFPLELCFTASGERYRGLLQGPATTDFIQYATTSARTRREINHENLKILAWHQNPTIRAHGLSINPNMMEVKASILEPPRLFYGSGAIAPRDGSWNLRGLRFLQPARIKSYVLICFSPQIDRLDHLGREIMQSFRATGLSVPGPPSILIGNPQGNMESIFQNAITKAEQDFRHPPDLVLIVLKASSIPVYYAIKQSLDVVHGIASQVMLAEKVFKDRGQPQYLANISMKVNVKLGGINCTINNPLFKQARWMLIGGDISSASPSAMKHDPPPPSTAALCGTIDRDCTSYIGNATMQPSSNSNRIVHAGRMFKDVLTRYKEKNQGLMPEILVFYRDGVSESEFEGIRDTEGRELRRLCQNSGTKITIIVTIKRHHTRFFAEGDLATRLGNVPVGTVIENSSSRNDAYIVAHKDLIGTKRPTRYVSIVDENNLSPDVFHSLTYELCSTYARATTSVAVVPPIYYSDQIAERAKMHLQDAQDGTLFLPRIHDNLKWNMYWQ